MDPFEISVSTDGDRRVLEISGELDMSSAPELEQAVEAACREGVNGIVLDLQTLDFIDSRGLGAILDARAVCEVSGREFYLLGPLREPVRRLFEVAGVADMLPARHSAALGG